MGKYRKVDPQIWNDDKFQAFTERGKLCFFFVLTHPHLTSVGAMRATVPGLASELGWTVEAFREAFREASENGMIKHSERHPLIWLPNFLKYNVPENPNVVKHYSEAFALLPECPLKDELIQHIKEFMKGYAKGFQEALAKALPKASRKGMPKSMPNPEQEQEQEQEQDKDSSGFSDLKEPEKPQEPEAGPSPRHIFKFWNDRRITVHKAMTKAMESKVTARLRDGHTIKDLEDAIQNYATVLFQKTHGKKDYWWSHRWTLLEFLEPKNLERFLTLNKPLENFKSKTDPERERAIEVKQKAIARVTTELMKLKTEIEAEANRMKIPLAEVSKSEHPFIVKGLASYNAKKRELQGLKKDLSQLF